MVNLEEVKDVLAVIGLYEDGDEDCNNALIDHETGLKSSTVDEVLEYLWKSDQIEGDMMVGGRNPSLDDGWRALPGRARTWGDAGCRIGNGCGETRACPRPTRRDCRPRFLGAWASMRE